MSDCRSKLPPRRPSSPQAALDALLADPAGDPIRRALWLDELDLRLRPYLPAPLAAHARLANYEHGRLVYLVDAPVWRAKLRLLSPELLGAARSVGLAATEFVIKTSLPAITPSMQPLRKIKPMSAGAQQALQAALASLKPAPTEEGDAG